MYRGGDAEGVKFIYAQSTLMGFWWRHLWTVDLNNSDTGIITTTWSYWDNMYSVHHIFAHGNNAIDTISFTQNQLPPNTTIEIWQEGTEFTLQLIELRPRFPVASGIHSIIVPDLLVYELLVDNGFIEPSRSQYP
ncbi:MAG: hypothetical protein FWC78_09280 [Defluviitaleaceae bacterium]|nr:hypothetical protein [Defluviitaleaceae bacterium]